jgi:hypothetical protein
MIITATFSPRRSRRPPPLAACRSGRREAGRGNAQPGQAAQDG